MNGVRIARGAAVLSFFLLVAMLCHTHLTDPDLWWHLATGDLIRHGGRVPRAEPFSYTAAGRPWVDPHWLFQEGLSFLRQAFGLEALGAFRMILVPGLFLFLFRRGRRLAPPEAVLGVLLLAAIACQERFLIRPEVVSWWLLAFTQAAIDRSFETPSVRHRRALLWGGLTLIQLVWVNVQGLFMIGPALAAMALLDSMVARLHPSVARPHAGQTLDFMAALAVVSAACLMNPYGAAALGLPFEQLFGHLGGTTLLSRSIAEFQPPLPGSVAAPTLAGFALLGLLAFAVLILNARKVRPFDVLVVAATLYLALRARRNLPIFAIAAVPVILRNARAVRPTFLPRRALVRAAPFAGATALAALSLAIAWSVATNRFFERWPSERWWGHGAIPYYFPEAAARFVEEAALPGRVFHSFTDGGFLIDVWGGKRPVFIDGRNDPYLDGVLETYLAAVSAPAAFEEVAQRYGIDVVLWSHSRALAARTLLSYLARSDGWILARLDPAAAVYVRARAVPEELRARAPFGAGRGLAEVDGGLERDLQAAPFAGPPLRETGLAEFFAVSGDFAGAALFYRRALAIEGGSAPLYHDYAVALTLLGRTREALEAHQKAVAIDPAFLSSLGEIGVLLLDEGRVDESERYLTAAYERGLRSARILEARARLLDLRGQTRPAVAAFQEAVNLAPGDPALLRGVALFYLRHRDEETALSFYAQAARADPGNPILARESGEILERLGRLAPALEAVRRAASQASGRLLGAVGGWLRAEGAPWPSTPATLPLQEEERRLLLLTARLEARAGDRARASHMLDILRGAGLLRPEELNADPLLRRLSVPHAAPREEIPGGRRLPGRRARRGASRGSRGR